MAEPEVQMRPRRVLIIGGGPCGLVTLRNLLERGHFEDVQLVERRDNIGGVWYHPPNPSANPSRSPSGSASPSRPKWDSPAYPGLIGNVIPEFLSFSGYPFPTPLRLAGSESGRDREDHEDGRDDERDDGRREQSFPTLRETYEYLERFAKASQLFERGRIRLNREVVEVEEVETGSGGRGAGGWRVVMMDWSEGGEGVRKEEMWDAVVITTVWFDNAYYPDVDGLDDVRSTGRIRHAKTWRGPEGYEGKRVIVIGNANSANEMAAQLAPVAQLPVYRSTRRVSIFPSLPDDRIQDVGPVVRYSLSRSATADGDSDKITVHLKDRTIQDVDYVLFGTGYYPDIPYLRVRDPTTANNKSLDRSLIPLTDRTRVNPARIPSLYRHILYAHNTSLAFIGALVSFIPFAMADLTSTWLALVWSPPGCIEIPSTIEGRLADERARLEILRKLRSETINPSDLVSFHFLGRYELPYAKEVRTEIVKVVPELGDVLASWDDEQDGRRFAMYAAKLDSLYALAGKKRQVE